MWVRAGLLVFQNRDKLPYIAAGVITLLGVMLLLPALFLMVLLGGNSTGSEQSVGIQPWLPVIEAKATQYGVDPALVAAVMTQESGGNPRAVSPVGAVGLMQLMPNTAKVLGVTDLFNPEQNISGGTHYLANLLSKFRGNIALGVAAYNAGPGAIQEFGGVPPYTETEEYVQKVLGYYLQYQNQELFKKEGISSSPAERSINRTNVLITGSENP